MPLLIETDGLLREWVLGCWSLNVSKINVVKFIEGSKTKSANNFFELSSNNRRKALQTVSQRVQM